MGRQLLGDSGPHRDSIDEMKSVEDPTLHVVKEYQLRAKGFGRVPKKVQVRAQLKLPAGLHEKKVLLGETQYSQYTHGFLMPTQFHPQPRHNLGNIMCTLIMAKMICEDMLSVKKEERPGIYLGQGELEVKPEGASSENINKQNNNN